MSLCDPYRIEPIWKDRTVVCVGGGPSLSLKQIHQIGTARGDDKCRVIAVNDAVYPCFWADWLHAGDLQWWRWHIQRVNGFQGIRTTVSDDVPAPWVNGYLEFTGDEGFDPDPSCLKSGRSSGYQAICIGMHTAAKRVVLVGFDMKFPDGGDRHWFGDHPTRSIVNYETQMMPSFETLLPAIAERNVEVINCSPGSALTVFPMGELEKVLRHG